MLGEKVLRKEDPKFLTTGGVYIEDFTDPRLDGAVHVVFTRSPVAHGTINSIDTSEAEGMPGVLAVYIAASLGLQPQPSSFNPGVARTLLAVAQGTLILWGVFRNGRVSAAIRKEVRAVLALYRTD